MYEEKKDALGRIYATGKRKCAIARVWVSPGTGKFVVNGKEVKNYFMRDSKTYDASFPLKVINGETNFDVMATVSGGGLSAQAGAVKLGISRALTVIDSAYRGMLKPEKCLVRDARVVERKKYGMKKARKRFQFSKR